MVNEAFRDIDHVDIRFDPAARPGKRRIRCVRGVDAPQSFPVDRDPEIVVAPALCDGTVASHGKSVQTSHAHFTRSVTSSDAANRVRPQTAVLQQLVPPFPAKNQSGDDEAVALAFNRAVAASKGCTLQGRDARQTAATKIETLRSEKRRDVCVSGMVVRDEVDGHGTRGDRVLSADACQDVESVLEGVTVVQITRRQSHRD